MDQRISTVEAMAAGILVVSTRSGGPEEIIYHGKDGVLVPVKDPKSLADAIRGLIVDKKYALQLPQEVINTVQKLSIKSMISQYENLYMMLSKSQRALI